MSLMCGTPVAQTDRRGHDHKCDVHIPDPNGHCNGGRDCRRMS